MKRTKCKTNEVTRVFNKWMIGSDRNSSNEGTDSDSFFAMVQDDNNFSLFLKGVMMKKYARLIVLLSPRAMSSIMFDILEL